MHPWRCSFRWEGVTRAPAWGLNVAGFIFPAAALGTCSAEGEVGQEPFCAGRDLLVASNSAQLRSMPGIILHPFLQGFFALSKKCG